MIYTKKDSESLVSVITPSYNSSPFIKETIESVQAQSYSNWEMIIVDDNSKDDSVHIIKQYIEKDPRIKLITLTQNAGAARARNIALKEAQGDYIAFLDSDDLWLPTKLEEQVAFMQNGNLAFSFTSYSLIDEQGNSMNIKVNAPKVVDYKYLLGNTTIGCLTVMLDRHQLKQIEMPVIQPEDTALWLALLRLGYQAYGLQKILSKYRIVSNSTSRNKLKAAYRYWKLLRNQEKLNFIKTNFYFSQYAYHAYKKNRGDRPSSMPSGGK
ncbi:glycosyltransferase family 2 protein [Bacillus pseudomycoides]|uniref:glycosyltransferase family 2 protein n=1 Tax=Bacillus pseudomycoides TaxID=64104 RepID=UPI000BED8625|nr:glycosyltransferase family 2 protein [Bacillus pseudomycoides]PEE40531.1 glycosyl transferase [Bacillus pseudomycoides]PEI95003.1 glycosyl transferase [Bacillus pseudomycoides]PGA88939.1 glycosyl transferase [Bacillus pseudomycoides]PHF49676.1 glycosyl transferase [Bacillus pseudomycoides]